jgi:hypothetical protein
MKSFRACSAIVVAPGCLQKADVTGAHTDLTRPDKDSEDQALLERIRSLCDEGRAIWERFDEEVRSRYWHPFVPADYERVLSDLLRLRHPGGRFLEMGSASGVIAIMADFLGFEAYGIEIDPELVAVARSLAERHGSDARFAAGSFVPSAYVWKSGTGDDRLGTLALAEPAYAELGCDLSYFDVVFAYPWDGEEAVLLDIMRRHGAARATLLLHGPAVRVEADRTSTT